MADNPMQNLTTLTVELLGAYLSNNMIASEDLAGLIQTTHKALAKLDAPAEEVAPAPEYTPAVSIRKSLASRDHIISLIDGKPYKTLKRHLASHGLTIAEYRARYNLPASYPTVAAAYSEHRRDVAKKLGLGRRSAASSAKPAGRQPKAVKTPAKKPMASKAEPSSAPEAAKASSAPPAAVEAKPVKQTAASTAAKPARVIAKRAPQAKTEGSAPAKTAAARAAKSK